MKRKGCYKCGALNLPDASECSECGSDIRFTPVNTFPDNSPEKISPEKISPEKLTEISIDSSKPQEEESPFLSKLFYLLSALSLIGGVLLALLFLPNGYETDGLGYTWSIVWLIAGIIEAALFAGIGQVLSYLHKIAVNTAKN